MPEKNKTEVYLEIDLEKDQKYRFTVLCSPLSLDELQREMRTYSTIVKTEILQSEKEINNEKSV